MLGALALAVACSDGETTPAPQLLGGDSGHQPGIGDPCTGVCRDGLVCRAGSCQSNASTPLNGACTISAECADGLQCAGQTCQTAGEGVQGDACTNDLDCERGLRCTLIGFGMRCMPEGPGDVGDDCETAGDCVTGLACLNEQCTVPPPGVPTIGVPTWQGVSCDPPSTGQVRAYFEVPGAAGAELGDFFRLPFPNDVRIKDGQLDLSGFPTPGASFSGVDPVQPYVDRLSMNATGWGAYPTVLFRFSGAIDADSLRFENGTAPVRWIDITEGAPEYGTSDGLSWSYSSARGKYVCDHWLGVRRSMGRPLLPGHTYAVWITTDARTADGGTVLRSENLAAVLASATPSDAALAAAHASFAPFRSYLEAESIDPDSILSATVITTEDPRQLMSELNQTLASAELPSARNWVKCAEGVTSPCPDHEGERACGNGGENYDEYHALVSLPSYQQGEAPYSNSGGNLDPNQPNNVDVCLALTVPKGSPPAEGWPLVIFAHGTGGSFRSHVRAEVAGALAEVNVGGDTLRAAVLGIDQVQHGTRRGGSTESPSRLFFNFQNPDAARGNPLQGAVDQLSLARFAASLDLSAEESGGEPIRINENALAFFGHSQGATHGSLMLPYSDTFKAAVLSGNGASLMDSLLTKTSPENIAQALPFVLQDPDAEGKLFGGVMHPVLSLLQHWIDPADPLNFAVIAGKRPLEGRPAKHIFQTYGLGDSFSPPSTLATYALAAELELAAHDASVSEPDPIGGLTPSPEPLMGNVSVGDANYTLAVRQYSPPSGVDGHFVVFDLPSANQDAVQFLAAALFGQTPSVPH